MTTTDYNDAAMKIVNAYRVLTSDDNLQPLLDTVARFDNKCFNKRFITAVSDLPTPQGFRIWARLTDYRLEIEYYRDGDYSHPIVIPLSLMREKVFTDAEKKRINGQAIMDNIRTNADSYMARADLIEQLSHTMPAIISQYNDLLAEAEALADGIPYEIRSIYRSEFRRPHMLIR